MKALASGLPSSCLGGSDARSGPRRPALKLLPTLAGCGAWRRDGGVVVVEPALAATGDQRKDADMSVGHGDLSLEVGIRNATASATGRLSERMPSETSRNPMTRSALATGPGEHRSRGTP
jgi:hypothetical protein